MVAAGGAAVERKQIPRFLPAEFLESDDEEEEGKDGEEEANGSATETTLKKVKFSNEAQKLTREKRRPRDRVIGSTVFRVMADRGSGKMTPRANKNSVNQKAFLLQRNRTAQPRAGFYVKQR
jgi:U3 small nucleolar RNA-associated protein 16